MFIHRITSFVSKNKIIIQKHIIGWVLFFASEILIGLQGSKYQQFTLGKNAVYMIICFYFLVYKIFLPFLPRQKVKVILVYFAFLGIAFFCKLCFDVYFLNSGKAYEWKSYFFAELYRFNAISLFAFAYWIYLESIKEQKVRRIAESKLLKSEIAFLKAQINPHFVFNVLNFVYNDVAKVSHQSGEAILSLTKLMRYSVESTTHELGSLAKEVTTIDELLLLQRLRFGDKLQVQFIKHSTLFYFAIPPLLLLSIVENAFKYGITDDPENPIIIELDATKDRLDFSCKNKIRQDFKDKETTAVGQKNIRRRLEMAFQDRFDIKTIESEDYYSVQLQIFWLKTNS